MPRRLRCVCRTKSWHRLCCRWKIFYSIIMFKPRYCQKSDSKVFASYSSQSVDIGVIGDASSLKKIKILRRMKLAIAKGAKSPRSLFHCLFFLSSSIWAQVHVIPLAEKGLKFSMLAVIVMITQTLAQCYSINAPVQ